MDFHSILGKLRAIESLGTQGIDDRLHEAEGCTMTAEGEACPVHGIEECDSYQGTIQMEDSRGEMMDSDTSRDDHAERAGRKVAKDIEYDERKKDDEEMDEATTEAVDPKTLMRDIVAAIR